MAAVIADGAALGQIGAVQPLGNALRGTADGKLIQAVASKAHDAADPRSSESQLCAEAFLQRLIVSLHCLKHVAIGNRSILQPVFVLSLIIHFALLFIKRIQKSSVRAMRCVAYLRSNFGMEAVAFPLLWEPTSALNLERDSLTSFSASEIACSVCFRASSTY